MLFLLMAGLCAAVVLVPEEPPLVQELRDGAELEYELQGMRSLTEYELLVSWPASRPALFRLSLAEEAPEQRSLLNTEKLVFSTRKGQSSARARLVAHHDGIPVASRREEILAQNIVFTIALKQRRWGLPVSSMPVVLTCVIIVAAAVAYVLHPMMRETKRAKS